MNYRNAKIYFDGSHYIAIPQGAFSSGKVSKKATAKRKQTPKEQHTLKRHTRIVYPNRKKNAKRQSKKPCKTSSKIAKI